MALGVIYVAGTASGGSGGNGVISHHLCEEVNREYRHTIIFVVLINTVSVIQELSQLSHFVLGHQIWPMFI